MLTHRVTHLWLLTALISTTSATAFAQGLCEQVWNLEARPSVITNAAHRNETTVLAGEWRLANSTRYSTNSGVPGAVEVHIAPGTSVVVRDLHYQVAPGQFGLRLLPTVERPGQVNSAQWRAYPPEGQTANGTVVKGSEIVDAHLRKELGLREDQADAPLFALVAYSRMAETRDVSFSQIKDLSQNRTTHLGAYLGKGITRHSPRNYAETQGWNNAGYPVQVSIVTMRGVEPAVFNSTASASLRMLNEFNNGVRFPEGDYKFDYYRQVNLKEVLDYYRGWIDAKWERTPGEGPFQKKLLEDPSFHCYCSEHVTLALNVAANVPHNKARYQQIWGQTEGAKLYELARQRYQETFREPLPETEFTPLWERQGIRHPTVHTRTGDALVWHPMTVADLLRGFMTQYANWQRLGPVPSGLALLGFAGEANRRIGLPVEQFVRMSVPVIAKMLTFHAAQTLAQVPRGATFDAAFAQYLRQTQQGFETAITQGGSAAEAARTPVNHALRALEGSKTWVAENPLPNAEVARMAFERAITPDLAAARAIEPLLDIGSSIAQGQKFVQHYSPPHLVYMINNGLYQTNPHIQVRMVGTTLPASELVYSP